MTQKDKMLMMVLKDSTLQEKYDYDASDYESLQDALYADNALVVAVAKIIKELNASDDPSEVKRVYNIIYNHLNNKLLS